MQSFELSGHVNSSVLPASAGIPQTCVQLPRCLHSHRATCCYVRVLAAAGRVPHLTHETRALNRANRRRYSANKKREPTPDSRTRHGTGNAAVPTAHYRYFSAGLCMTCVGISQNEDGRCTAQSSSGTSTNNVFSRKKYSR